MKCSHSKKKQNKFFFSLLNSSSIKLKKLNSSSGQIKFGGISVIKRTTIPKNIKTEKQKHPLTASIYLGFKTTHEKNCKLWKKNFTTTLNI